MEYGCFQELEQLLVLNAPPGAFSGAALPTEVNAAEEALGVRFSPSYRWFLLTFGSADWPGYIFGVGHDVFDCFHVVNVTRSERCMDNPMPEALIPFAPDGGGNHYCIDTSTIEDKEAIVVLWMHDADPEHSMAKTHASFSAWLSEFVNEYQDMSQDDLSDYQTDL